MQTCFRLLQGPFIFYEELWGTGEREGRWNLRAGHAEKKVGSRVSHLIRESDDR